MPRMSLMSSESTTDPAEKGNGYNPDQLGLVIKLVITSINLYNYFIFYIFLVGVEIGILKRRFAIEKQNKITHL